MNDTVEKQPADEAYRKVSIPLWGKKYPVYLHSLVALGILIGGWILLHFLGAQFMGQEEEGSHLGHAARYGYLRQRRARLGCRHALHPVLHEHPEDRVAVLGRAARSHAAMAGW